MHAWGTGTQKVCGAKQEGYDFCAYVIIHGWALTRRLKPQLHYPVYSSQKCSRKKYNSDCQKKADLQRYPSITTERYP